MSDVAKLQPRVTIKINNEKVIVSHVVMPKGTKLERHSHKFPYVVHPLKPGRVRRITYSGPNIVGDEKIVLSPGEPYYVTPAPPGQEIEIENEGDGDADFDKDEIK